MSRRLIRRAVRCKNSRCFLHVFSELIFAQAALENAHGRIMDADIAVESGQLAKQNVIRESSVSMQVQANRLTYLGLTLIGAG